MTAFVLLLAFHLFPIRFLLAQRPKTPQEWGFWGAGAVYTLSAGGLSIPDVQGRNLILTACRYSRVLEQRRSLTVSYTLDIIPAAVALNSQAQPAGTSSDYAREDVYGFGACPLGFTFHFLTVRAVQPFIGLTGGFLRFQEPVPDPVSTRWNFTATAGGGLRLFVSDYQALTLGYMFHHLSNGRAPEQNPSLNTHMLYFGFSFFTTPRGRR